MSTTTDERNNDEYPVVYRYLGDGAVWCGEYATRTEAAVNGLLERPQWGEVWTGRARKVGDGEYTEAKDAQRHLRPGTIREALE